MKKFFILLVISVFMLSGCSTPIKLGSSSKAKTQKVEEKKADLPIKSDQTYIK
jgi:uncharacterized protein YceK